MRFNTILTVDFFYNTIFNTILKVDFFYNTIFKHLNYCSVSFCIVGQARLHEDRLVEVLARCEN